MLSNFNYRAFAKTEIAQSREYEVVVHDAKTAASVFRELEKLNISNTRVDRVGHTKLQELKRDVKVDAVKAAREKAVLMAQSINQGIGRAIYAEEIENIPYQPRSNNYGNNSYSLRGYSSMGAVHRDMSEDDLFPAAADIDFENIKLEASVLVRFELK
jgi:hypothetical protein